VAAIEVAELSTGYTSGYLPAVAHHLLFPPVPVIPKSLMTRPVLRGLAASLLLACAACARDATQPVVAPPEPPRPPVPVGVYELSINGIGGAQPSSTILPAAPAAAGGPSRTLLQAGAGLTFEQASSSLFTEGTRGAGGQRYVSFTYRVRNGTSLQLKNLTLLMVQRTGVIAGTPLSGLRRFDGTAADPAIAPRIVPTGEVALRGDLATMQALDPDVLQVFQESEVAPIARPGDVTDIFPYGYVVRSTTSTTSRTLPVATSANQWDGVLTVSFRVPLQATSQQDVFSLTFEILAVTDSETRMTESMEEAQDTSAVRRLRERAAALGATTVTVLPGSTVTDAAVADYPGQRQVCSVRTAGDPMSPVTYINAPAAYTRLALYMPGESYSACGASFRSGTLSYPLLAVKYPVTVRAMDRYGNVIDVADTVALSQTGSSPTVSIPAATPLAGGEAVFPVTYGNSGTSALSAKGARYRGVRSLNVPVPSIVSITQAGNEAGMAGVALTYSPEVMVRDQNGNALANVPLVWTVTSGGGSLVSAPAVTGSDGSARVGKWILGPQAMLNTLTVSAAGSSVPVVFNAPGCASGTGAFAITLCYTSPLSDSQRAAFDSAAARWSQVITGDLADASVVMTENSCYRRSPLMSLTVDDIVILVGAAYGDGVGGTQGSGTWCSRRFRGPPQVGYVRLDSADVASVESSGLLPGLVRHYMGHALGLGYSYWSADGMLTDPVSLSFPSQDTWFSGAQARAAFDLAGGTAYTGNKVPVENAGGSGLDNEHWRESVMGSELMTSYLNTGPMPLSRVTVGALADMGYAVDTTKADAYTLPSAAAASRAPARGIRLWGDVPAGPRYVADANGRLTRIR
jgi:hypothetical protein